MNLSTKNFIKLIFGVILYAIGIAFTVNANVGVAPWDAFHQGLSLNFNITFGQASITIGFIILVINYILGEQIGIGTIVNIFGIGIFVDYIFQMKIVPVASSLFSGLVMLYIGAVIICFATYFYIAAGYGAGPRDGLMVALMKKTGMKIGFIRAFIEISVLTIGFLMGGKIGIGTVLLGFSVGPIMQFIFKIIKFDVKSVKHKYIIGKKPDLSVSTNE